MDGPDRAVDAGECNGSKYCESMRFLHHDRPAKVPRCAFILYGSRSSSRSCERGLPDRAVEAERAAGREALSRARRGVAAEELDRLLSAQRHSAERDKAAALAGLKQLYASELAQRDGHVRDLRAQRDSVMASVRQRDAALQVCVRTPCLRGVQRFFIDIPKGLLFLGH